MGAWFVALTLVAVGLPAAETTPPAAAVQPAVADAIRDLGDARYAVRQRASKFLWQQGLAAEAALKAAAESPEVEVRLRARRILEDFQYGILPTVSGDIVELIQSFRSGTAQQRLNALQRLAAREQYDTVQRLIRLEANRDTRRQLLIALLQNARAAEWFIDKQGLPQLVALVGADQDETWRRTLLGQLLTTERILERLAEKGQLETLDKLVSGEKTDQARRQVLTTLFQNPAAVGILLDKNQLDFLLQLIIREPDQGQRANWLSRLVSVPRAGAVLADEGRLNKLLQFAQQHLEAGGRDNFLHTLTQNPAVIALLWKGDQLGGLVQLAAREADPAARGRLLAILVSAPAVRMRLTEARYPAALIKLARDEKEAAAREAYMKTLMSRGAQQFLLRDADGRKALWELVKSEPGSGWRGDVVVQLVSQGTPEQLLGDQKQTVWLLRFAHQDMLPHQRSQLLSRLLFDVRWLAAVLSQGQIDEALKLAAGQPADQRKQLWRRLLTGSQFIPQLAASKRIDALVAVAKSETDADARRQYLETLFQNAAATTALIEGGQYETLRALVQADEDPTQRATLFAALVSSPAALKRLAETGSLGTLVDFARNAPNDEGRRRFLLRLYQAPALAVLLEQGHFDALFALADGDRDPVSRTALLAGFYANAKVIEHLAAKPGLERLLRFAQQDADEKARRQVLGALCQTERAVDRLVEQGHDEALRTLARAEQNAHFRGLWLGAVLASPRLHDQLAARQENDSFLQWIREENDPEAVGQVLQQVFRREPTILRLIDAGRTGDLLTFVDRIPKSSSRAALLAQLVSRRTVFQRLIATKRLEPIIETARTLDDADGRRALLESLLGDGAKLASLARHGCFEVLADLAERDTAVGPSQRLVASLLEPGPGCRLLADPQISQRLVKLLKSEAGQDQSYVQTALSTRLVWQTLIDSGQADRLTEIADLAPDEAAGKSRLRQILYAPSGTVARHLRRGELTEAERLLEPAADDDLGRLRLATYLLVTGQLDQRMAAVQRRWVQSPSAADARLLTYLARAKGDLSEARRAAELTRDQGLLKAVLVEQRAWAEAAALQAAHPCPLPVPTAAEPEDTTWLRLEQLGLTAAYQRLARQTAAADKTLEQIRQLAETPPHNAEIRWMAAEALLLNDRVDEGLAIVAKTMPSRAFAMLCFRQQNAQALELVGWRAGAATDKAWLDSLPVDLGSNPQQQAGQRLELALAVAHTLHQLGRRDEADQLITRLEAYVQTLGPQDDPFGPVPVRPALVRLCLTLVRMGEKRRAWEVGARALSAADDDGRLFSQLYLRRHSEAEGWWTYFRTQHPTDSLAANLQRVADVLLPPPEENAAEFRRLVAAAEQLVAPLADDIRRGMLQAVAESCARRGLVDLSRRLVDTLRAADESPALDDLTWEVANALYKAQRWEEAAGYYEAVWQSNHDFLPSLFLAGDALQRAGRTEEGRQRKELAHRTALDSTRRRELGVTLLALGLQQEGVEQLRLVLRTAPLEHWEWNDAARWLGERAAESDPAVAADLLQHSLLDDLRWNYYLVEPYDYLRTPAAVHRHRAVAAMKAGDVAEAEREIDRVLNAVPSDTHVAEELVPLLERAGRRAQAEALFTRVHRVYQQGLLDYPQSALLHNNLAWVSARCHRRLDDALQHAQRANELVPDNAAYVDTLAEAYFRLGDRERAIRYSRRAVQLQPRDETLQKQLARFEHDPLP